MAFFPLDQKLGIGRAVWSEGVGKGVCRLAARMPFAQAAADYEALTHIAVSGKSVERTAHAYGGALVEQRMSEAEAAWQPPAKGAVPLPPRDAPRRRGVSLDGTMIHTRVGWKEVKVASFFGFQARGKWELGAEGEYRARTFDSTYCTWLGSVDQFGPLQWAEAGRRQVDWAKEVVCVSDAAAWIEKLSATCYPQATNIVDWWHASEHIWTVAKAVYGEGTEKTKTWAEARSDELWKGRWKAFEQALAKLESPQVETMRLIGQERQFFRNHRERMDYSDYRRRGLPIGSGSVESACKNIVGARCKQAGMRWTEQGAQAILFLRAELLSDRWDQAWELAHRKLAPNAT